VLLQAAADAGAEVRQNFSVTEAVNDANGTVTGIRGRTAAGTPVHEAARLTVGADGRRSAFAGWVGAPLIEQEPPITFWYFSYWSGMPNRGLELIFRGDATIFTFPTGGDLTAVFVAWKREALDRVRANVDAAMLDVADRAEEFGERLRRGCREERIYGATDLPNFIRRAQGPGWALVGDAACHKDPMLALGICDAFRDAELLAQAARDGLSGRDTIEAALGRFDRQRLAATMPDYHENIASARMEPPPDLLALRARLRDDPAAVRQFYLAREGMIATHPVSGAVSG